MGARIVVSLDGAIIAEVPLTKPVTVVGRHPSCDIHIDHPAVSGRHMLFRAVNRTLYAEDLASTNGMKVNGLSTLHQVVHHLDMIEIGRHRLHFFDDDLAPTALSSLEDTVHTDFERTSLAAHVPPPAAAARPAAAPPAQDFSRTMSIERDYTLRLGGRTSTSEAVLPLALRVASGARRGEKIVLEQANTMLGTAGEDSALVVRRNNGFFLVRFGGPNAPRLNGREVGSGAQQLNLEDQIEVGGNRFEVIPAAS